MFRRNKKTWIHPFGAGSTHKRVLEKVSYGNYTVVVREKCRLENYDDPLDPRVINAVRQAESPPIFRARKYFLVESEDFERTFCITLDRTVFVNRGGGALWQLEIECPTMGDYSECVEKVALLARYTLKAFPELQPTIQTKRDWAKS